MDSRRPSGSSSSDSSVRHRSVHRRVLFDQAEAGPRPGIVVGRQDEAGRARSAAIEPRSEGIGRQQQPIAITQTNHLAEGHDTAQIIFQRQGRRPRAAAVGRADHPAPLRIAWLTLQIRALQVGNDDQPLRARDGAFHTALLQLGDDLKLRRRPGAAAVPRPPQPHEAAGHGIAGVGLQQQQITIGAARDGRVLAQLRDDLPLIFDGESHGVPTCT